MRSVRPLRPLAVALLLAPAAGPLAAQEYWRDDSGGASLRLDLLKPWLRNVDESFLTGSGFLAGSVRVTAAARLEGDLPFARASFTSTGAPSLSASRIGNPYLGLVIHREGSSLAGRVGARLPLMRAPDDAVAALADQVGILADQDRSEAFLAEGAALRAAVEYTRRSPGGLLAGLVIGPTILIDAGGGLDESAELLGDYGARVGLDGGGIRATLALTGRIAVTESGASFDERTVHQVTGRLDLRRGMLRPSFLVRLPLDESVRDDVGVVVGLGIRVGLGPAR